MALDVTQGDLVRDDSMGANRDVDVAVTITFAGNGGAAISGFEVKRERKLLNITDVEQLCNAAAT